ncbi:Holliday junction branch migration protein RuvA [Candidatus Giovannonibacteria bacterium]|nr:Holliday junction branch migration protein RuvA [Candidatus Giovannonibacteria bacterium]
MIIGYNEKVIYSISGKLVSKFEHFVVVEAAGLGLKVFVNKRTLGKLPSAGTDVKLFSYFYLREDGVELYGFVSESELRFFEMLISVSGVGPKSALTILDIAELKNLAAAIKEGRPDLLTKASGIGRKTAERIILELKSKVQSEKSEQVVRKMETDADLVETLVGLGYRREEVRAALSKVDEKIAGMEDRLKAALKVLSGKY